LQSIDELRKLYTHFPHLWERLKAWDRQTWRQFRKDYSVRALTIRFELEKEWGENGKGIKSRAFYKELRERMKYENDQNKSIGTHDQEI
jgi:hypothetical protein